MDRIPLFMAAVGAPPRPFFFSGSLSPGIGPRREMSCRAGKLRPMSPNRPNQGERAGKRLQAG